MKLPMIAHIVAASENGVIGKSGELPWNIPGDMEWFRSRTRGRALIMGRKTFEAVGHPLPHRLNVIVTHQKEYMPKTKADNAPTVVCSSIDEALNICRERASDYHNEIFIIGGGEIYRQSMPLVDTIYLTRVHAHFDGDAYYPEPDPEHFQIAEKVVRDGDPGFTILTYKRKI